MSQQNSNISHPKRTNESADPFLPAQSKQRRNKGWRSETDPETSDDGQASGAGDALEVSGEETPVLTSSSQEEEEAWGCSSGMSLEVEPLDPLNYNYYFRRLSDSALESGPSTPVRGPPLLGMERIFIEIEDVERDALLEDEGFPVAHLAPAGEGTAAQTSCGRLDPMEDVRLRLEFSTLEEEDEEEAQKEEEEMAALARGTGAAAAAAAAGGEESEGRLGLANLNTNNSNRLAGKRSCPAAFDVSTAQLVLVLRGSMYASSRAFLWAFPLPSFKQALKTDLFKMAFTT